MIRSTTNGVLKSYRYSLQHSTNILNKSRDTVLTGRRYNSFADDPAAVAQSFQLRSSLLKLDSQYGVCESAIRKFDVAWSTLNTVVDDSRKAKDAIMKALNDTTGTGRVSLGKELTQLAKSMTHTMNTKYGENFVFAGNDGLNVPFELKGNDLYYRGINVNSKDPKDIEMLKNMTEDEKKYADIGLGLKEDTSGNIVSSSGYNVTLQGTTFVGYGLDDDGDPKNVISIIGRIGEILEGCNQNGEFKAGEKEEFERLSKKFEKASANLTDQYTKLDTQAGFLKENKKNMEATSFTLQEQIMQLEKVDPADAITAFAWAQYSYNAALKVGNNILSQSLMDYIGN